MSYTGVYDKTIYYDPVSKYCVISVKTNDQSIPQKARSAFQHRDRLIRFTAVGYELSQTDRVSMILSGRTANTDRSCRLSPVKRSFRRRRTVYEATFPLALSKALEKRRLTSSLNASGLTLFKSWKSNPNACWRYEVLRPQSLKKSKLPMTRADAFAVL